MEYKEYQRLEVTRNIFTTFESFICGSINLKHLSPKYRYGLETLLIFSGFFLSNFYLAYLSSILLTKIYQEDIDSIQDVVEHNLTILTTEFHQFVLEASQASPLVRQQSIVVSEEMVAENLKILNPEYVYFALESRFDFYLYQQKFLTRPRMKKLANEIITTDIGELPMRSYWPLQDILMDFMDNLFCHGIYQKLFSEAMEDGIHLGQIEFIPTEGFSVEALSVDYFVICGLLLGSGYALSLICLIIEIMVYNKLQSK